MGPGGALPFGALVGAVFAIAAKPVVHDMREPLGTLKEQLTVPERVFDTSAAASTAKTLKAVIFNSTDVQPFWLAKVIAADPTSHTLKEMLVRPTTDLSNAPETGLEG